MGESGACHIALYCIERIIKRLEVKPPGPQSSFGPQKKSNSQKIGAKLFIALPLSSQQTASSAAGILTDEYPRI